MNTEKIENQINIRIAVSEAEKKAIFSFRYHIYVTEMDKHRIHVNANTTEIVDPLDAWGLNMYASIKGKIIGVNRVNIGTPTMFPADIQRDLALHELKHPLGILSHDRIALFTKLMIDKKYRNSTLLYQFMKQSYALFTKNGAQFGFGGCSPHLIPLYEQIGLHRYTQNFMDDEYGLLVPLIMLADDEEHFRQVRSPLYRLAKNKPNQNLYQVDWFHNTYLKNSKTVNSKLLSTEALWQELCVRLQEKPTIGIPLLNGLTEQEAARFLHDCSVIFVCSRNDQITIQGETSYCLHILLSGHLMEQGHITRQPRTFPGHHFGADGLTEQAKHKSNVVAITPAEILVVSGVAFLRFLHRHPATAQKIIKNMQELSNPLIYKVAR